MVLLYEKYESLYVNFYEYLKVYIIFYHKACTTSAFSSNELNGDRLFTRHLFVNMNKGSIKTRGTSWLYLWN